MPRKVKHKIKRIGNTNTASLEAGELIEFNYRKLDMKEINDRTPIVFVLDRKGKHVKGININYLTAFRIKKLLNEKHTKHGQNLRWYEFYDEAIRTYNKKNMRNVKIVEYVERSDENKF